MNIVDRAAAFAERAHKTQRRKYTLEPYFVHLTEVANLCARHAMHKRAIAAAYLHDVVEDFKYTNVTQAQVAETFGREISDLVAELTDTPEQPGLDRAARKRIDTDRLEAASSETQSIRCADVLSNTPSIVRFDLHFSKIYVPEIRAKLTVITRAIPALHRAALTCVERAERELYERSK